MIILNESKRDDLLIPYVEILKSKGINATTGQLKQWLLKHLTENGGLRNLSLGSNFYLSGAAKYYFNGDLTVNKDLDVFNPNNTNNDIWKRDVCERLNVLILILRNVYIDSVGETFEQPEDFGDLPITKLLRKYGAKINKVLGIEPKKKKNTDVVAVDEIDRTPNIGNGYTFEIIYNYQDAKKYESYTYPGSWCITYSEHHYNTYLRQLGIHYVIIKQNGFENVPREMGKNGNWVKTSNGENDIYNSKKPQDEYGCSLIALLQSNKNGEPIYITSRWNHGSGNIRCEADHAFTKEELFKVTGMNDNDLQRIFKIWEKDKSENKKSGKKRNKLTPEEKNERLTALRFLKYAQIRINGGESPDKALLEIPRNATPDISEMLIDSLKRTIAGNGKVSKSVIAYHITVEGLEYFVLVDRGKILYDTLTPKDEYHTSSGWGEQTYDYTERQNESHRNVSKFSWIKNAIVIKIPGNKYMIYNLRNREFLNIDGITKFKYLDSTRTWKPQNENILFYEIKMSHTQTALINSNTNTPLILPNGNSWFEKVKYDNAITYFSREIRPNIITDTNNMLTIIYDSAANEIYFYDINKKRFVNIDVSDFFDSDRIYSKKIHIPEGNFIIAGDNNISNRKKVCKILKEDGTPLSIGGIDKFMEIRQINSCLHIRPLFNENVSMHLDNAIDYIWDGDVQSFVLNEDGTPLKFCSYGMNIFGSNNDILMLKKGYSGNIIFNSLKTKTFYLYSITKKVLLINPINNSKEFSIANRFSDINKIEVYNSLDNDDIIQHKTTELYLSNILNEGYYVNAVKPNSAPLEEKRKDIQNTSLTEDTFSENEAKYIIQEIVNRILKK